MGYNQDIFNMCMMGEMRAKRDEIYAIARKHKAEKLCVFGSYARCFLRGTWTAICGRILPA